MKAIVVVDQNWNIGCGGRLLVHVPADLKYFKEKTAGKVVVMGRLTFESLPNQKPLPNRTNIIITKDAESFRAKYKSQIEDFKTGQVIVVNSKEELLKTAEKYPPDDVFITGGGKVYTDMLAYCNEILVTKILKSYIADTRFPDLDQLPDWEMIQESEPQQENEVEYKFTVYKRIV